MSGKYTIGIDEVGRGPLLGPVAVGIVVMEEIEYAKLKLENIFLPQRDSKKLSAKQRLEAYNKIIELKTAGRLNFGVFFQSNKMIDHYGIVPSIRKAIANGLKNINIDPAQATVLLDGGLKAPAEYLNQQTIIRGDETELIISLASIVAKVCRDEKMDMLACEYCNYDLANNKGYGTKLHLENLKTHGPCDLHRLSFLKRLLG